MSETAATVQRVVTASCHDCDQKVECQWDNTAREWFLVRHASSPGKVCHGSYVRVRGKIEESR